MESRYLETLPDRVQGLVRSLEDFSGLTIGVQIDESAISPSDPNPDRLAARITSTEATILVRNGNFSPQGVTHELLHIRRYWLDQIPQVVPLDNAPENNWEVTGQIENALEHLVIVPQEAEFGFEPYSYWDETERRNFSRYPWPDISNPWARKKACLLGALGGRFLVRDPTVTEIVRDALNREGMLRLSWEFAKRVHDRRHNKRKMLELTLQALGLPHTEVKLIELRVQKRQTWQLPF